ncbi:MAG: DUF1799 domain-containing protein [Nitrococcus mobilis]|nr:DUF1799 domain-containing protein [Nitrococcus mobilis]
MGGGEADLAGVPAQFAEAIRAEQVARQEVVEVWPENWPTVELFCAVITQWRASFGGLVGLDYTAEEAAMRMLGIRRVDRPDLFAQLRVMEHSALAALRGKGS